jgi:arsenate reductase-like glutaredoxin family protein
MQKMITQLMLVIHSEKPGDQDAIQYMKAIPGAEVTIIDLATTTITAGELTSLAEKLGMPIEDLLDSDYDDHISVHTEGLRLMDRQSLLTLMAEDTKLIATPIVVMNEEAFLLGRDEDSGPEAMVFEVASRLFSAGQGVNSPER